MTGGLGLWLCELHLRRIFRTSSEMDCATISVVVAFCADPFFLLNNSHAAVQVGVLISELVPERLVSCSCY